MSDLQSDITHKKCLILFHCRRMKLKPLFHQMYKYFCYALEGKHLLNKIRLRISSDSVMLLIIKDGWRLESWSVV
jgi:hypothetical protein